MAKIGHIWPQSNLPSHPLLIVKKTSKKAFQTIPLKWNLFINFPTRVSSLKSFFLS